MSKTRITFGECECNQYPNHVTPCCDVFKYMLNDCRIRLIYIEQKNMYGIKFTDDSDIQEICYCPWCGTKFSEIIEKDICLKKE